MVIIIVFFYVLTIYLLVNACLAGEKRSGSCGSFEADVEEPGEKQFGGSHRGSSKSKKRQKDFVNRNIEVGQSSRTHHTTWHEPPVCFSTPKDTDLFLIFLLITPNSWCAAGGTRHPGRRDSDWPSSSKRQMKRKTPLPEAQTARWADIKS